MRNVPECVAIITVLIDLLRSPLAPKRREKISALVVRSSEVKMSSRIVIFILAYRARAKACTMLDIEAQQFQSLGNDLRRVASAHR